MQKQITIYITTLLLILICSCDLSKNNIDNPLTHTNNESDEDDVEVEYSPHHLYGKTVKIDAESRYYNFTTNGTCQISKSSIENLFGTPIYTYSRVNSTTAKFYIQYVDKITKVSTYTNTVYTYYKTTTLDITLHFTSPSGGTYSGKMSIHRTGYHIGTIYVAPKTSYYSPSGKFSLL